MFGKRTGGRETCFPIPILGQRLAFISRIGNLRIQVYSGCAIHLSENITPGVSVKKMEGRRAGWRLPALDTLDMDRHLIYENAKGMRSLEIECPPLVCVRLTIHAGLAMSTSWFTRLEYLYLTLHDVSS